MGDTVDTVATVVDTEAMEDTVLDTGESTESVRLRLNPRLPLSLTTATVDTVATVVDTEDMVDTVLDTRESTESVRLRPSLTMAMEATVVDTVATEATEVTVMATASNMFLGSPDDFFFAQP